MRKSSLLLIGALSFGASCYYADFDPDASNTFVCVSSDECPNSQECFNGVCVSDEGPSLSVIGPEPYQRVAAGNAEQLAGFTITVRGSGLALSDSSQSTEGSGYIEVSVDGQDQFGRIVAGDLSTGLTTDPIDLSDATVGPHRIDVQAYYGDGKPYGNPSAANGAIFFIDDGSPQLVIVEPAPGHVQRVSEPLQVTVAAINWTWNSANSPLSTLEGHTHVYSLNDYPACLAEDPTSDAYCNFKYLASFSGSGDPDNMLLIHGEVTVDNLELLPFGTQPFQAGLQDNEHEPFPTPQANEFDLVHFELIAG